jgi:hypothetical protein
MRNRLAIVAVLSAMAGGLAAGPALASPAPGSPASPAGLDTAAQACKASAHFEHYQERRILILDRCSTEPVLRRAVFIDQYPLTVYRADDGTYYSPVNAYESFPTLLATARAAVDTLGPDGNPTEY